MQNVCKSKKYKEKIANNFKKFNYFVAIKTERKKSKKICKKKKLKIKIKFSSVV